MTMTYTVVILLTLTSCIGASSPVCEPNSFPMQNMSAQYLGHACVHMHAYICTHM